MTHPLQHSLAHGRRMLTTILMSVGLCSCANGSSTPSIPLQLPFAVDQEGCQVESTFQIDEQHFYSFTLSYVFRTTGTKEGDAENRARVWKLVGGHEIDPQSGLWIKSGAPLVIRLTVTRLTDSGEQVLFDSEVAHPKLSSWGETLDAQLTEIQLPPGRYRFIARSLKSAPELQDVQAKFKLTRAYKGK